MPWQCFIVKPTSFAWVTLLRWAEDKCPMFGNHRGVSTLPGEVAYSGEWHGDSGITTIPPEDPRWPLQCPCGYQFKAEDKYMVTRDRIFVGERDGHMIKGIVPPGYAPWLPPGAMYSYDPESEIGKCCRHGPPGPDGKAWWIVLPGGRTPFEVYGLSTDTRKPWTVTGTPPTTIHIHPSIRDGNTYHGHVEHGVVLDDCDGRRFTPLGMRI